MQATANGVSGPQSPFDRVTHGGNRVKEKGGERRRGEQGREGRCVQSKQRRLVALL